MLSKKLIFKTAFSCSILLLPSFHTFAEWEFGVDVERFSNSSGIFDQDFISASFTVGYQFDINQYWQFIPSVSIGTGVGEENIERNVQNENLFNIFGEDVTRINEEISRAFKISAEVRRTISPNLYAFVNVNHLDIDFDATLQQQNGSVMSTFSNNDNFGLGAGIGVSLENAFGGKLGVSRYGTDNLLSLSVNYRY